MVWLQNQQCVQEQRSRWTLLHKCLRSFMIHKSLWQAFKMVRDETSHKTTCQEKLRSSRTCKTKHDNYHLAPCGLREENQPSLGALQNAGKICSYSQRKGTALTVTKWTVERCSQIMSREKSPHYTSCGRKSLRNWGLGIETQLIISSLKYIISFELKN